MNLFLDTNYILHYPPIRDTDWVSFSGASKVSVHLCMQVIHELDEKKYHPLLKDRARAAIKEIRAISADGNRIRESVSLILHADHPSHENYPPGLSPHHGDEVILASVLKFTVDCPDEKVSMVSEDLGMEIKCLAHRIPLIRPLETTRLPDIEDQQGRKLKQALADLERLKNTFPDLFVSGGASKSDAHGREIRVTLPPQRPGMTSIDDKIEELKKTYPRRGESHNSRSSTDRFAGSLASFGQKINADEYKRYDNELDAFFRDYRAYLDLLEAWESLEERSFLCYLSIENKGRCPGQIMDVHLHFPDGMDIFDLESLPPGFQEPIAPKPPKEPRRDIEKMFSIPGSEFAVQSIYPVKIPALDQIVRNVSRPAIRKTSSYEVHYEVKNLKHGYIEQLGSLMVLFPSRNEAKSFHADFTITADNLPEANSGQLHFILSQDKK